MSKGLTISFTKAEQDKFRAWVRKQTAETKVKCQNVVVKNTMNLQKRSMMSSPVDMGMLRGSIKYIISGDKLGGMVYAGVKYAPYQEFGTGNKVMVLPGYEAYAMQFKGRGIRKVNIRPRMFFFRHFEVIKREFIRDLNRMGFK
jgi:hypothetical protein